MHMYARNGDRVKFRLLPETEIGPNTATSSPPRYYITLHCIIIIIVIIVINT